MSDDVFLNVWDSPWEDVPASSHADKTTTPTTPNSSIIGAHDTHITGHNDHEDDDITISSVEYDAMKVDHDDNPFSAALKDDTFTETEAEAGSVPKMANIPDPDPLKDADLKKDEKNETEQEQSQKQGLEGSDQACSIDNTDHDSSENVDQSRDDPDPSDVDNPATDISNANTTNTLATVPSINQVDEEVNYDKTAANDAANDATIDAFNDAFNDAPYDATNNTNNNTENEADNDTAKTNNPVIVKDDPDAADLDAESGSDNDDFGDFEAESEPPPGPPKPQGPEYKVPVKTLLASIITPPTPNDSTTNSATQKDATTHTLEPKSIESILNINHARKYKNLITRPTRQFLHVDDLPDSTISHLTRRRGHRMTMSMSSAGALVEKPPVQSNVEIEARKIMLDMRRSEKPKFNFSWHQPQRFSLPPGRKDISTSVPSSPVTTLVADAFAGHFNAMPGSSARTGVRSSMIVLPTRKREDNGFSPALVSALAGNKSRSASAEIPHPIAKDSPGNSSLSPATTDHAPNSSLTKKQLTINTVDTAALNAAIAASIVGPVSKSPTLGRKSSVSSSDRNNSISSSGGGTSKIIPSVTSAINPKPVLNPGSSPVVAAPGGGPLSATKAPFLDPLTPSTPILPFAPTMAGVFKSTPPVHATPFPLKPTIAVSDSPPLSSAPVSVSPASLAGSNATTAADVADDEQDDDWGDFVSESSPTPEPALTPNPAAIPVPQAPIIPASATFAPAPPPPQPPVKLSLGPLQPTTKSKSTQENEKVDTIVATLPNLSFMLDEEWLQWYWW